MSVATSATPASLSSTAPRAERSTNWPTLLGLVAVFLAFGLSWMRFPGVWNASREHGFMVAALCIWLVYRDRHVLLRATTPEPLGLIVLTVLGALWLVSVAISVQVGHLLIAPMVLVAWLTTVNGRAAGRAALPMLGFFLLAVPLWEVLQWPLQQLTIAVNAVLFKLFHLQGAVVGNQIRTPWGVLEIAYECAGLNYLLASVTIGGAYVLLFVRERARGYRIIAVAAALAIIGNWVRVFGLAVIASVTRMQSPLVHDHAFYGWVIFAVFMVGFFMIAQRLEKHIHEAEALPKRSAAVHALSGAPGFSWRIWTMALALAVSAPLLLLVLRNRPMSEIIEGPPVGIAATSPWHSVDVGSSTLWTPGFTGATRHSTLYWRDSKHTVRLDRYSYRSGRQEGKMIGSTNRIAPDSQLLGSQAVGPLDNQARTVIEAAVRHDNAVTLAWYWYRVAGVSTAQPQRAKLLELVTFLFGGSPAEILVVSAACNDSSCANARSTLYNFVTGKTLPSP